MDPFCSCPVCGHSAPPIKPGFNNCDWKVIAVTRDNPESIFRRAWVKAGNEYTTYCTMSTNLAKLFFPSSDCCPKASWRSDTRVVIACHHGSSIRVPHLPRRHSQQNVYSRVSRRLWTLVSPDLFGDMENCPNWQFTHLSFVPY